MARQHTTGRERCIAMGLVDADGNITPEGEAWTDEQIEALKRQRLAIIGRSDIATVWAVR